MIKRNQNWRRMATALMSVLIWTFGSLAGPGMIFCVAGPDHAAIEPNHFGVHKPYLMAGDQESAFGWNLFRSAERGSGPCTDMPISGFAFTRLHSEYSQFMKISALPLQTTGHHDLGAWTIDHHAHNSSPSIPLYCDSHLKTTVLLI